MKRLIVLAVIALAGFTAINVWAAVQTHATVPWPAACRHNACVNHHLNDLKNRVHKLSQKLAAVDQRLQTQEQKTSCWFELRIAQYPHNTVTSLGDTAPGSGGTWLDLMHTDNPASNSVYHVIYNACAS